MMCLHCPSSTWEPRRTKGLLRFWCHAVRCVQCLSWLVWPGEAVTHRALWPAFPPLSLAGPLRKPRATTPPGADKNVRSIRLSDRDFAISFKLGRIPLLSIRASTSKHQRQNNQLFLQTSRCVTLQKAPCNKHHDLFRLKWSSNSWKST